MKRLHKSIVVTTILLAFSLSSCEKTIEKVESKEETCLITSTGVGPIKLGFTLDEAKKSFPEASFERVSDGEGVALVNVKLGNDDLMSLYADEYSPVDPINWSKEINSIETFSQLCMTESGIRPGSKVLEVEKILGETTSITISEIESRQYIGFEKQPKRMGFRLDYTGIFEGNARETTNFEPNAKILSINIY